MSVADGREPDPPRAGRGAKEPGRAGNDPDEVTRRGAAGRWLVALFLTARETSDQSSGAGPAPALSAVQ